MPLPETIPIRRTEEEAGYVSVRPIVRQIFRVRELIDMILSVAGKDAARVRQILRSGTVVYHFLRYSWTGFDADDVELANALAEFPDDDPTRVFAPEYCTVALFESGGAFSRVLLELDRAEASKRKIFRHQSFWQRLLEVAVDEKPQYQTYSYGHRADLYRFDLNQESISRIEDAANRLAPRKLRFALHAVFWTSCIVFVCPRK